MVTKVKKGVPSTIQACKTELGMARKGKKVRTYALIASAIAITSLVITIPLVISPATPTLSISISSDFGITLYNDTTLVENSNTTRAVVQCGLSGKCIETSKYSQIIAAETEAEFYDLLEAWSGHLILGDESITYGVQVPEVDGGVRGTSFGFAMKAGFTHLFMGIIVTIDARDYGVTQPLSKVLGSGDFSGASVFDIFSRFPSWAIAQSYLDVVFRNATFNIDANNRRMMACSMTVNGQAVNLSE